MSETARSSHLSSTAAHSREVPYTHIPGPPNQPHSTAGRESADVINPRSARWREALRLLDCHPHGVAALFAESSCSTDRCLGRPRSSKRSWNSVNFARRRRPACGGFKRAAESRNPTAMAVPIERNRKGGPEQSVEKGRSIDNPTSRSRDGETETATAGLWPSQNHQPAARSRALDTR